ncbi:hypothetical protein B5M42_020995 [Paenibacillus athensensis]|uniref:TcpE family protein n=1 Tax=Paenibacillus athensensis TaxID=1967502 RepID=A0A4Y8PYL2_9BACL|nr:TcpE family conjugal transfer membrane protein [Paenibacillus athensensis]MCD1261282.1 hypothetical protein [Paenibacillus athensensis]
MEQDKTESYRALYRVRPLIYHVGDIRLWIPIRQDGIVLWFVYLFLFFVFCYVFPVLAWIIPLDRVVTMLIGPIAAAYYTVKLDPAGKTVPRYLQDIVHFLLRPKWVVRWQAIRYPVGKRRVAFIGLCKPYNVLQQPKGVEEWRGSAGLLRGKVRGLQSLVLPASVRVRWQSRSGKLTVQALKGQHRNAVISPASLQAKRKLTWITSQPVQVDIHRDSASNREIWKVKSGGIDIQN